MATKDFGETVFQQFLTLYVNPELQKRKKEGKISDTFDLRSAQIIFHGDGRPLDIRINSEVRAVAVAKKKKGISKEKGEAVYEQELTEIIKIKLTDDDDPNCGHATLVRLNNIWYVFFDFRYNKAHSLRHLKVAKEFYETAEFAFKNKHWKPFTDNLFSAAELIAKATLLLMPNPKFVKKTTHKDIQMKYNAFAKLGNVKPKFHKTFNKLSGRRIEARYLKKDVSFSIEEGQKLLDTVKEMLEKGFKQIE